MRRRPSSSHCDLPTVGKGARGNSGRMPCSLMFGCRPRGAWVCLWCAAAGESRKEQEGTESVREAIRRRKMRASTTSARTHGRGSLLTPPFSAPYLAFCSSRTKPQAKVAPTRCSIFFPSGIFQTRGCFLVKLMFVLASKHLLCCSQVPYKFSRLSRRLIHLILC